MKRIQQFFKRGFADLNHELGSKAAVFRNNWGAVGNTDIIVTPKDGSLSLDYNGVLYTVNASALIPSESVKVKIGDKVLTGKQSWLVIGTNTAPHDYGISLDLVAIDDATPQNVIINGKKVSYKLNSDAQIEVDAEGNFVTI